MRRIVLIAETCEPRGLDERALEGSAAINEKLALAGSGLNRRRVKFGLITPFTVIPSVGPANMPSNIEGSEVQAVFRSANELWSAIFELEYAMFPVRLRFGIGIGEINTAINPDSAIGMHGEAFDNARESVESLNKDGKHYRVQGLAERDALVLHMLNLISSMRKTWRVARIGTFLGMLKKQTVAQTVELLGISEQAVYRNIRDGELGAVQGVFLELSQFINDTSR